MYLKSRVTRESSFHSHSPNGCIGHLKPGTRNVLQVPSTGVGTQVFESPSTAFPQALAGNWITSSSHMGCQHCRYTIVWTYYPHPTAPDQLLNNLDAVLHPRSPHYPYLEAPDQLLNNSDTAHHPIALTTSILQNQQVSKMQKETGNYFWLSPLSRHNGHFPATRESSNSPNKS